MRQLFLRAVQVFVFLFVLFGNIYFEWQLTGQLAALFALISTIFATATIIAIGDFIAWVKMIVRRARPEEREQLHPSRYPARPPVALGFQGRLEQDGS